MSPVLLQVHASKVHHTCTTIPKPGQQVLPCRARHLPSLRCQQSSRKTACIARCQKLEAQSSLASDTDESSRKVTRRLLSGGGATRLLFQFLSCLALSLMGPFSKLSPYAGGCCCGLCALLKPALAKSVTLEDGFTYDAGFAYGMVRNARFQSCMPESLSRKSIKLDLLM